MSNIKYWIWLSSLEDLRPKTKVILFEHFESPEEIYFATESEYKMISGLSKNEAAPLRAKNMDRARYVLDFCAQYNIGFITLQDAVYPERLKNIYDPPVVLYIKGTLPAIDEEAAVAVIGTRRATPYGIKMARKIGYEIAMDGGLVVSGLTAGIDSAGAEGSLRAGKGCVGILGTAINEVYPAGNRPLFSDVAASGALISEYPPGFVSNPSNFRDRNRIISGISAGVAVIEAPQGSGALLTAACALEQGRDIFAVPANADSTASAGSNELLKDSAKIVTCGWDILCEYEGLYPDKISRRNNSPDDFSAGPAKNNAPDITPSNSDTSSVPPAVAGSGFEKLRVPSIKKLIDKKNIGEYIDLEQQLGELTEKQLQIISVICAPSMHVDDIIDLCRLPASEVLAELTLMQIAGYIIQEKGKRFSLNITIKRGSE